MFFFLSENNLASCSEQPASSRTPHISREEWRGYRGSAPLSIGLGSICWFDDSAGLMAHNTVAIQASKDRRSANCAFTRESCFARRMQFRRQMRARVGPPKRPILNVHRNPRELVEQRRVTAALIALKTVDKAVCTAEVFVQPTSQPRYLTHFIGESYPPQSSPRGTFGGCVSRSSLSAAVRGVAAAKRR